MLPADPAPDEQPPVQVRVLAVPKGGASADEYEDAATAQVDTWPVRTAVADGATESVFAREWANLLVEGVTDGPITPTALVNELPTWQAAWAARRDEQAAAAPWYVQAKAEEGAFATLLGFELCADGQWRAVGVGDCVLLHLRDGGIRGTWPVETPEDFTNRPALLPSRPRSDALVQNACRATTGEWQVGDGFLLATDAVAAWLLRSQERSKSPVAPADARTWSLEDFRNAVATARSEGTLHNDDSTLLVLEIAAPLDDSASA